MHIFIHNGRTHSETHICGIQEGLLLKKVCMLQKPLNNFRKSQTLQIYRSLRQLKGQTAYLILFLY